MSGWMCDACRRSVYRASDGYFCCLAPGMERITASRKKPVGGSCGFYEARAVEAFVKQFEKTSRGQSYPKRKEEDR